MQSENKFLIPLAVIIAGALVAGAVFFKSKDPAPNGTDTPVDIEIPAVTAGEHILGSPNAEVVIVEYSDIDCPFCASFHATMHRIVDEYGSDSRVSWVYRNFPLDQLHPEARKKAETAECVASLAGNTVYWQFLDALFTREETLAEVPAIAAEFGVDTTALNACTAANQFADKVQNESDDALAAGGRGTPYSIVVTKSGEMIPINGAQPYNVVKQVVDTILAAE